MDGAPAPAPPKPHLPSDAVPAAPKVLFNGMRVVPDMDGLFLANKETTTIGAAVARGKTDLHITGCANSISELLTPSPMELEILLHKTNSSAFETTVAKQTTLYISNRMRLNVTTSRSAVGIDGTIVKSSLAGQASVTIDSILDKQIQHCSTTIPMVYANWAAFSSVVEISHVRFINPNTGREYDIVVVYDDDEQNQTCKRAANAMEQLYNQADALRKVVVFEPAPNLTKTVMRVPFGIDGSTYDLCASVVCRPISLERASFESMIYATLQLEMNSVEKFQRFMEECASPGITASRWSGIVANALSLFVSSICPYRVDGCVVMTPNGLSMTDAECWKAEAARTQFETSDDCEGDAAHITSVLCDARRIALDESLALQFPTTVRVANAMSLHFVGTCVLAANAGNAGEAGVHGATNIAGHAIAMAIPRSLTYEAMIIGAMASTQNRALEDSNELVKSMSPMWLNAMFTPEELASMPDDDVQILTNSATFLKMHKEAPVGEMEVLGIEGTSPVTPSLLYSRDVQDRLTRRRVARGDKKIATLVGPTVARMITQLDVGTAAVETKHTFYHSMVEFSMSTHEALFKNVHLREAKHATAQLVICQAQNPLIAGASPQDMATGNFGLLSLWKLDSNAAADLEVGLAEVEKNTMPKRVGFTRLDEDTTAIYKQNITALRELGNNKDYCELSNKDLVAQYIFAVSTLLNNRNAVQVFIDKLQSLIKQNMVAVSVDIVAIKNCIFDSDGIDVGKFVTVNVELLVTV